jgi:hypothetical protein
VTLNSEALLQGSNTLTVQYLGNSTYAPSSYTLSTALNNPLSDFSITSASPLVAVTPGSSATASLFVTPTNGFTGTVNLSCSVVGSPAGVSCSLPSSAPLTSTASSPVTLTISATGTAAAGNYSVAVTGTASSQIHTLGVTAAVQ